MNAIGRGQFPVGPLSLPAFVFNDSDLASNLLGVAPFSNMNCTATFTPTTFQICDQSGVTILSGHRRSSTSLWLVNLNRPDTDVSVTCLPQTIGSALHVFKPRTDAQYVRFVHAALCHPAPTTFLHAVSAGFITRPSQFPRLTKKMVRRYLPQAMVTARAPR